MRTPRVHLHDRVQGGRDVSRVAFNLTGYRLERGTDFSAAFKFFEVLPRAASADKLKDR
jgi:hypothetical protein